nr:MAG TPA: hypothetical protein [Caudoviricetes sp.]
MIKRGWFTTLSARNTPLIFIRIYEVHTNA